MAIAINIKVNTPQSVGAPTITVSELRKKIQAYVNSLSVNVIVPQTETTHTHSLSSLRGICKSGISDQQAIDEHLDENY